MKDEPAIETTTTEIHRISARNTLKLSILCKVGGDDKMNLLIVDNNQQHQQIVSMLLKEGYYVKTARHGKEALTLLHNEHFDGIISEVLMPVMDGFQLCRTVKLHDTLKGIPFIFLTNTFFDDEDERFALVLGADLFLRDTEPGKVLPEIRNVLQHPKKPKKVLEEKVYLQKYSANLKKKLDSILQMQVRDSVNITYEKPMEDSTERKKAEEQLRESEENYRNIVELAPDGIVTADMKGVITSCNTATLKLTGYSYDEVVGKHFSKLGFLRARDLPKYIEIFSSIIRGNAPEPVEIAWNHRDGTTHLGEVHVSFMKKEGKTTGIQVIARDITERKKAEEELRESEEKYRNIVELAPDGIATVDLKGVITSCNTAFSKLTGFSKDELVGKHFTKLPTLRAKDLPKYVKMFSPILKGKISGPIEFVWRHKDGSIRLGEAYASLMKKGGKVIGIQGVARDITERKKAEEMLRQSEEKYRSLVENLNVGVYRTTPGEKGQFIDVNQAFVKMLGYNNKKEMLKLKVSDIYMNPKDRIKFSEKIALQGFVKNEELHLKRKDGTLIIISDTATPVYADGTLLYFDGISEDITERKRMEEALKESEEKYRSLVENSKDSIVIIDLKGNVQFANKATEELTGYTMEEGLHMNVRQITPLKYWPKSLAIHKKAITGEPVPYFESVIRKKDKTLVPVESRGQAIFKDGKVVGIQVITRDITERKQAEEHIKQALREKEVLLQEIHHRVKNNMQIIYSLLSLQSRHITDDQLLEVFRESQNRIKSMALVHEKLYQSEDLANIDFKEYIKSLVNSLFRSCRADTDRIALEIDVEDVSLGSAYGVPCGLIINELVSNCVKHAFPENRRGKITIRLRKRKKNEIELIVSDNGVGIPDSIDANNTDSLGLRLVTILAEDQLKGKIKVDRNEGTKVSITFRVT